MNFNPKQIVTVFLLLFVALSMTALIVRETRVPQSDPATVRAPTIPVVPTLAEPARSGPVSGNVAQADSRKVVVYYFHGNVRCRTCRAIESLAHETVQMDFQQELTANDLEWRSINIEEPGNEHFVEDYDLVTRSVIVAEFVHGQQVRWTNLKRVWELVKQPDEFRVYIAENVAASLETK